MIRDLLLGKDDKGKPPPGPAFVVGPTYADRELLIAERCFREAARDFPGSGRVIFIEPDEETGEELFENAAEWRVLMSWPRDPTLAEAIQWQTYQDARAQAALWFALQPDAPGG